MTNKIDSETALARIKIILCNYYEGLGRGEYDNSYDVESGILGQIDDILDKADIDVKKVIIEKLEGFKGDELVVKKPRGLNFSTGNAF